MGIVNAPGRVRTGECEVKAGISPVLRRKMEMKKVLTLALLASAAVATSAFAQTSASGTVLVTGTVPGKCSAIGSFSDTINLGDISTADGLVLSSFGNNVGGLSRSFTIVCTSANASITVSSDSLNEATDNSTAGCTTPRFRPHLT